MLTSFTTLRFAPWPSDLLNTTEKQVHMAKQNHRSSMSTSAASFGLRQLTGLSSNQIIP
ncbi:hypothetical protein BOX15_Mlig026777g1 [Macrostomum lignano]|uniref:Uncharacterized protein n=1 Tax=Macrostomum lignano TaxID=282301 RepID=A0A267E878_9PLAT|nr:hypothetical protein BOX15_Mlig026777g1 [Macrostomum lignano]